MKVRDISSRVLWRMKSSSTASASVTRKTWAIVRTARACNTRYTVTRHRATAQHSQLHRPRFPVSVSSVCSCIVNAMSAFTLHCILLWLQCTVTSCLSLRVVWLPLHVFKSRSLSLEYIHLFLPLNSVCCRLRIVATHAKYEHRTRAESA
ncbi:hypothetical protein EI94DRAFT_133388 [Lactarius quietus]|nr:hypothetical protein EI94DRAFT_133388 [Lactarius quietus]